MSTQVKKAIGAAVGAAVLAATGASLAVGRSGTSSAAATTAAAAQSDAPAVADDRRGGFEAFASCLAQNGLTLSPGERPDFADPAVQRALEACRGELPDRHGHGRGFGGPPPGEEQQPQQDDPPSADPNTL